jgi:pimeloyl-ACP methyl ester carboxylesterase
MATIVVCDGLLRGRAHELAAALVDDGHDAVYVDPFTSDDAASYSFDALADAFDAGAGSAGDGVVAVGGSLASAGALAFARRAPDRCAALVVLHPIVLYGRRTDLVDLAAAVRRHGVDDTWRRLFPDDTPPTRDPAPALEGLGGDVLLDGPDDLAAIAAPTLLVARAGDPLHAMEVATAYWRTIPTTRMINEVPGDVPLWDRPADLAGRIGSFLGEVMA